MSFFKRFRTRANRDIRGAWSSYKTQRFARRIASEHGLTWAFVDNKDRSMGDFFSDRSIALFDPSKYEEVQAGSLVAVNHPRKGNFVVHRVKSGNPRKGWVIQGTYNKLPDPFRLNRENYRGTYVGQFTSADDPLKLR